MSTRAQAVHAILSAYRMQGLEGAYGMWMHALEERWIDYLDLELEARGNRVDEHAAQEIRDFDGVRRTFAKHGIQIKHTAEVEEILTIRVKGRESRVQFSASAMVPPDPHKKEDDRALAMLHAFSGLGQGRKGR